MKLLHALRAAGLVGAIALHGCGGALTSKSVPVEIHYFTPEAPAAALTSAGDASASQARAGAGGAAAATDRPRLRLGRVTSSAHLRARIVFRHSPVELGAYEDKRWTENPEAYLRRSLEAALYADRRVVQTVAGRVPVLDVELVAFEEVRRGDSRAGRVEVVYTLHDEEDVIASERLAVERDARTGEMPDVVAAIAAAMSAATTEVAGSVTKRLGSPPTRSSPTN